MCNAHVQCLMHNVHVQELDHTSATLAAMDASHERLAKSKAEYEKQTPLLTRSRRLLSKMSWHSVLDAITLYGCLALFFIVVAYIIQKRLLYFVPSFLIPSFGRSPAVYQQSPAPDLQSQAGLPPSSFHNNFHENPGSVIGPSVGGPPSNDRWYEAQPGYDGGGKIRDDQWFEAQPDDTLRHDAAADFGFRAQQQQPSALDQQHQASDQDSLQQQQQRQLEEAYREAQAQTAQPPASQPDPQSDALDPNLAATGEFGQQLLRPVDRPLGIDPDAAGSGLQDADTQIPITRSDRPKPIQVGTVPRGSPMAAPPSAAVLQAEQAIRQNLQESIEPIAADQLEDASPGAITHDAASQTDEDTGRLRGSGVTGPSSPPSELPGDVPLETQQQQHSQQSGLNGTALLSEERVTGSDAAADLDTYPGLENAADFSNAHAGLDEVDTPEDEDSIAADSKLMDLDTYPGLEQEVDIPDASQATSFSGDAEVALNDTAAQNVSLHETGLAEGSGNCSVTNSSDQTGPDEEALLNDTMHSSGSMKAGSEFEDVEEPGTPGQGREASLFRSSSASAPDASNERMRNGTSTSDAPTESIGEDSSGVDEVRLEEAADAAAAGRTQDREAEDLDAAAEAEAAAAAHQEAAARAAGHPPEPEAEYGDWDDEDLDILEDPAGENASGAFIGMDLEAAAANGDTADGSGSPASLLSQAEVLASESEGEAVLDAISRVVHHARELLSGMHESYTS